MVHHIIKQLQYIAFGAVTSWYFGLAKHGPELLRKGITSLPGALLTISIILQTLSIVIFLYVILYFPLVKGKFPDYAHWPHNELANIVPWLTFGIIGGWTTLFYALWTYTPLSFWGSLISSLGYWALTIGIIGLIPTPSPPPRPEGEKNEKPTITSDQDHHEHYD